jgi:hypothetical protein
MGVVSSQVADGIIASLDGGEGGVDLEEVHRHFLVWGVVLLRKRNGVKNLL